MKEYDFIQPAHLDVLKEIGNIGAGHAATSLSALLGKTIEMSVPEARVIPFQDLPDRMGGSENEIAAIYARIHGDTPGSVYFFSDVSHSESLIQQLTGRPVYGTDRSSLNDYATSAYLETGNIVIGSFLSAFADLTSLTVSRDVPDLSIDMAGAIISHGLSQLLIQSDVAIFIETQMKIDGEKTSRNFGSILLLFDPETFDVLFQSLGVNIDE
ncbi:chemotaxis protein CheC [Alkalicoccobacillus murimartini]|uniref:Chemotaxis protein CheC n=1 Tax=Alkalicoccobacillus murimartini TaxID=171685 RepID=A0ABT9YFC5_9BACI|nr:chemotaxis protein CheC [Alkalicoccobacillus murimartini]MDQ0206323.1 chemotaxis protein CheC [Alkalicoccobacillus murimartini]